MPAKVWAALSRWESLTMKTTSGWLLAMLACAVLSTVCRAEALPDASAARAADDATALIRQLDASEFSERQEASRKLSEAGRTVFPDVEKAAEAGTREVATRAVEILRTHFQGGDEATKQAAKASLERLAASGNSSAAQRAAEALNPQPEQTLPTNLNGLNPAFVPLMQRQAALRLQIGARAAIPLNGGRRTSVRSINGRREIEVQDGDKITKVKDAAGGGLEAEITEKVNGKETTRKIQAKDLDDLKKQDADAAQVYERYAPRPVTPETIKRQIESLDQLLERMKAQVPNNPNVQRSVDSLERTKQQYEQRLKDAEKAAEAKP